MIATRNFTVHPAPYEVQDTLRRRDRGVRWG